MCIFVEYMCVPNLAEKVPLVIEILTKQHRGSFLLNTLYVGRPRKVAVITMLIANGNAFRKYD